MHLYTCMSFTFELGDMISLTVRTTIESGDPSHPLQVSVNDIPLTEGDFEGACFSCRRTILECGDEDYGWQMIATLEDGREVVQTFSTPRIEFTPSTQLAAARSILFQPLLKSQQSITQIANDVTSQYDLLGRKAQSTQPGILILHTTDGKSHKVHYSCK